MKLLIDLIIFILFTIITYQDFKYRAISWYLIPVIFAMLIYKGLQVTELREQANYFFMNAGFVLIQIGGISLFVSIRNKQFTNIINNQLGIGDVLVLLLLCLSFSPINFILFLTASLIMTLLIVIIIFRTFRSNAKHIPLAGYLAAFFNLVLISQMVFTEINMYNIHYIENYLFDLL
ncbi:MAG: hypothetical protein R2764_23155 [Bacteroidales bacterium]